MGGAVRIAFTISNGNGDDIARGDADCVPAPRRITNPERKPGPIF